MKFNIASTVLPLLLASQAVAICSGFDVGIGNVINDGSGVNQCKCYTWPLTVNMNEDDLFVFFQILTGNVYDDSCNQVDGLSTTGNPCDQGIFGCSPAPIFFNHYTGTFTGYKLVKLTVLLWFH